MKVRVLSFDLGDEQQRTMFKVLYEGFMSGASNVERRNMATSRQEARVFDKLDPISVPRRDVAVLRELRERPGETIELEFESQDFDLILKYAEQGSYMPSASRQVRDFGDWLASAPSKDKE